MSQPYDLTGRTFGDLLVIGIDEEEMERRKAIGKCFGKYWKCKCLACGNYRTTTSGKLIKGHTTNCGCKRNHNLITHGLSKTSEYQIWLDMKQKCYNEKNKSYKLFGAKGVTVCEKWRNNFESFYTWMILRSGGDHSYLKLKEDAKEFSPENCYLEIQSLLVSDKIEYMKGKKFGKLTAEKYLYSKIVFGKTEHYWECVCDCGEKIIAMERSLLSHYKTSCGCTLKEVSGIKDFKVIAFKLHGVINHMRLRCYDPGCDHYQYYGGKGVTICDEWKNDDEKFIIWALKNGYKLGLTIERKDVNGNYCPENCEWIPFELQGANKSNNVFYQLGDEVHHLAEWGRILSVQEGFGASWNIRTKLKEMGAYEVPNPNTNN